MVRLIQTTISVLTTGGAGHASAGSVSLLDPVASGVLPVVASVAASASASIESIDDMPDATIAMITWLSFAESSKVSNDCKKVSEESLHRIKQENMVADTYLHP